MKRVFKVLKRNWQAITDEEYIDGLKSGDADVTKAFFDGLCNYTLNDIRFSLMQGIVDYDELVNELFIYLSAKHWHKLDTFDGKNGCSLKSWMVRVSWRFFMLQRSRLLGAATESMDDVQIINPVEGLEIEIAMDTATTFAQMPNKRYVQVLRWLLEYGYSVEEVAARLQTSTANVYNLKHRAVLQFIDVYGKR